MVGLVVVAVAALVCVLVGWRGTAAPPRVASAGCGPTWVTAWEAAMQPGPPPRAVAGGGVLRMVVHPQAAGVQVRVRLSNVYGSAPLVVEAVSAARVAGVAAAGSASAGSAGGASAVEGEVGAVSPGTDRPVRFGGRTATVVPPGGEAVSDPVPLTVSGPLAVTITVPALPSVISEHPVALQTSWVAPRGAPSATSLTSWLLLSGVDVLAPRPVHAVVGIGDSITDGIGTAPDADARWTDALASRLSAAGGGAAMLVLNAGISGNELLADGVGGPPPLARFAPDVTGALGVTDVVLNIGTNDIAAGRDAAAIEAGLARFADAARAAGKRVFLTTITPSAAGAHGTPRAIATRDAVNAWVRTHGREHAAGVVDFAAAVTDPAHPERLAPAVDAGDGLHLSAAGYRALAALVPVGALTGSPCLASAALARRS